MNVMIRSARLGRHPGVSPWRCLLPGLPRLEMTLRASRCRETKKQQEHSERPPCHGEPWSDLLDTLRVGSFSPCPKPGRTSHGEGLHPHFQTPHLRKRPPKPSWLGLAIVWIFHSPDEILRHHAHRLERPDIAYRIRSLIGGPKDRFFWTGPLVIRHGRVGLDGMGQHVKPGRRRNLRRQVLVFSGSTIPRVGLRRL